MDSNTKRIKIIEEMKLACKKNLLNFDNRRLDEISEQDYINGDGIWAKYVAYQVILYRENRYSISKLKCIKDLLQTNDYSNYLIAKAIIENEN